MALNKLEKEILPSKRMPMAVEGIMELEKAPFDKHCDD